MRRLPPEEERRLGAAPFSYDGVGFDSVPLGFRRIDLDLPVDAALEDARERLFTWRMHEGAGIRVRASAGRAGVGVVAVLEPGVGPLRLRAPVRVVAVEENGFSYGTLPVTPRAARSGSTWCRTATGAAWWSRGSHARDGRRPGWRDRWRDGCRTSSWRGTREALAAGPR